MPFLGISTTAVTLSGRLGKLRGQYVRLETQYRKLSTNTKRNLLGPFPEERFYVTAILQWAPGDNWFKLPRELQDTDIELAVTRKPGGLNEICPIWYDFFDDVREAEYLIKEIAPTPHEAYVEHISKSLDAAETKADWMEDLLMKITKHPAPPQSTQPQSGYGQYGYGGWNEMCLQVKGGALHVANVMCGHSGIMPPNDVLTATIKLFNRTAGIQSCTCGYDFSPVQPSLLGLGQRTAIRRWFMIKSSMLPFHSSAKADDLPSCVGWLFTDYNHHGQYDPARQYPFDPNMPASMKELAKRMRIPKSDLPDVSREAWDSFVRKHQQYLSAASISRARAMALSFSRQVKLPRDTDTVVAISVGQSPLESSKRLQTPQLFNKKDAMPGWIRGMPGWTPIASRPAFEERERRPHHDFNKKHAKMRPTSGRPTPQPSARKARAQERDARSRRGRSEHFRQNPAFSQPRQRPAEPTTYGKWHSKDIPADPVARFQTYQQIWSTLKPEDTGIPYPGGNALTIESFDAEVTYLKTTQYPQIPAAHLAGMVIQAFFFQGFSINAQIIPDITSRFKLKVKLTETDRHKVKALRKHLRRVESPRWHSDQINKRTGRSGVLDEGIGKGETVVIAYTACRDLLRVCEEYTRAMGWPA